MDAGFGLDILIPRLIINIRQFFRMVERVVRVKVVIRQFDILIVKLGVFGQDVIDSRPAITHQFFIRDKLLYNRDDFLYFRIAHHFDAFPVLNHIDCLTQYFQFLLFIGLGFIAVFFRRRHYYIQNLVCYNNVI